MSDDSLMRIPETRYARTVDGLSIAYQTAGYGPVDVVFMRGRLILLDRRGSSTPRSTDRRGARMRGARDTRRAAQAVQATGSRLTPRWKFERR
jgi:hypothetical protein